MGAVRYFTTQRPRSFNKFGQRGQAPPWFALLGPPKLKKHIPLSQAPFVGSSLLCGVMLLCSCYSFIWSKIIVIAMATSSTDTHSRLLHSSHILLLTCGVALGVVLHMTLSAFRTTSSSSKKTSSSSVSSSSSQSSGDQSSSSSSSSSGGSAAAAVSEEIRRELYSRSISFFGEEGFQRLERSFVAVVGVGGVGSHAANMLARAGLTNLRLIDFDQVKRSSFHSFFPFPLIYFLSILCYISFLLQ